MKSLYFENRLTKVLALKVAQRFDKYAALGAFSPLRYDAIEEPQIPNPRWLKVRNRSCGLCGTDIHFMFMDMDPKCFSAAVPGITKKFLGHELVGEVVELGAEVNNTETRGCNPLSPAQLKIGDRVAMRIDWPSCFQMEIDPPCRPCAAGNYMLCENLGRKPLPLEADSESADSESDVGGGFSPYMVMHRSQPYRIPDALNDDAALLLEPMASAVHGVLKAKPAPNSNVLVIGGGTIGLLSVAALRGLVPEAQTYCLVRYPFQARVAEKLGAHVIREGPDVYQQIAGITGARYARGYFSNEILLGGFDMIYDSVGGDHSLHHALRWVKAGGDVVLVGINFKPGKLDYSPVWSQEVRLTGINCHATESDGRTSFDVASDLLLQDIVSPADIITHRFPVSQFKQAVKAFLNKRESQAIKIVLDID